MKKLYSIFLILALLAGVFTQAMFAREVTVKSMQNGGVVDGLPQAILADSTARNAALPEQTTYVLDNGGTYPIVTEMENVDYLLHIRTADLDGAKAALVPAPRADQGYNDFFKFRNDGLLENLIIEAMRTQDPYAANRHNIEIRNSSTLTVKGCEIMHDTPGSAFSVWEESPEDRNSLFLEDCIIHSIGHNKSLGGNGRVLGVRSNMETLSLINVTFFNLTDRVFRHGKTGWDVEKVIVDHCTSLTTSGFHGFIQLGKAHDVTITNNIFFNPIAFGSHYNRVAGGQKNEQSQPEDDLMYVVTLDTVFADSKVTIANNNVFWEQQYKDLWAAYPDSTKAPGLLTPTIAGANSVSGDGYFSEALTFAAPPPSTYDYHQLGLTSINETIYPENFYFGLSSEIDVSYGTSVASYTAAGGGFPLGDLNAYPTKKAEWNNAGRPILDPEAPPREVTVKSMQNGGVVDGLPQAILADSTARNAALPQQTTYVLDNGGTYPIVTEMENVDYLLHIRTADLDGAKAALVPAPRADQGYNDFFKFRNDGLLENLIIEAMRTQDPYAANRHNIEIRNSSTLTVKGCEIMHDTPGSAFSVWEESPEDRNSLFLEDCIIHSIGHHKSLGGNGRVLGVRSNMETLSLINVTFFNLTDRVFRHGKTGWDVEKVIVDHCTSLTTSGFHGFIQLGKAHDVTITNNIFFNPIAFGSHYNRVAGGQKNEQSQPEDDLMYVVTLDTVFADSKVTIANNNIFWEQQYKDLWAAYPDSTKAPGLLTPTIEGANMATVDAYFSEALTFAAPSPSTYDYHQLGLTSINETIYPENFYFGLSSEVDVSYGTTAASYTAATGGFPLGDLNAYPSKKAEWIAAGKPITAIGDNEISSMPSEFKLSQNYPNPFNPSTTINFSVPGQGLYKLSVYNVLGQVVTTLVNGQLNAGNYSETFDASNLGSGIYFYALTGDNVKITKKNDFAEVKSIVPPNDNDKLSTSIPANLAGVLFFAP